MVYLAKETSLCHLLLSFGLFTLTHAQSTLEGNYVFTGRLGKQIQLCFFPKALSLRGIAQSNERVVEELHQVCCELCPDISHVHNLRSDESIEFKD